MQTLTREFILGGRINPCIDQMAIFNAKWPEGMPISVENAQMAISLGLDVNWVVRYCCAGDIRARYAAEIAPIRDRYAAEIAPIWDRYAAEIAPIRARYAAEIAPIWTKVMWAVLPNCAQTGLPSGT